MHVIVDANNIAHRMFHALSVTDTGNHTHAVIGFANALLSIIQDYKPEGFHVCFDTYPIGSNNRLKIYDQYKAHRDREGEIYIQLQKIRQLMNHAGICSYYCHGYEADDLVYTLSKQIWGEVIVVSNDSDLMQLASARVGVTYIPHNFGSRKVFHVEEVREHYGLEPYQIIEFKSLQGDTSDNVPGCCTFKEAVNKQGEPYMKRDGIGEIGAKILVQKFGDLAQLYRALDENEGYLLSLTKSINRKLNEGRENAWLSRRLCTLMDADILALNGQYDPAQIHQAMRYMGIAK